MPKRQQSWSEGRDNTSSSAKRSGVHKRSVSSQGSASTKDSSQKDTRYSASKRIHSRTSSASERSNRSSSSKTKGGQALGSQARKANPSAQKRSQTRQKATPSYAETKLWTKQESKKRGSRGAHGRQTYEKATTRRTQSKLSEINRESNAFLSFMRKLGAGLLFLLRSFIRLLQRSKLALIIFILAVVIGGSALIDNALFAGRAYTGIYVAGIDAAGKTEEELVTEMTAAYQERLESTEVSIYASEEVQSEGISSEEAEEATALAEQLSVEEVQENRQLWTTDAATLSAQIPYEDLAAQALAVGREQGGFFARLSALFFGYEIELEVEYDEELLESLATEIDAALGETRVDYDIEVVDGVASVVEGHDGMMVDRDWLADQISAALLEWEDPSFVAEVEYAALRIDEAAAQAVCDQVNDVLGTSVELVYGDASWSISSTTLGATITTQVLEVESSEEDLQDSDSEEDESSEESWELVASFDVEELSPIIASQAQEYHDGETAQVTFAQNDDGSFEVYTDGSGEIALPQEAVDALNAVLFDGQSEVQIQPYETRSSDAGVTYGQFDDESNTCIITLASGSVPEELSFEEALDLSVVSVISSYTTEYASGSGTENRNYNIHLASDLISGSIVSAGSRWSFNETAGNCDEEAGFLDAGAIVNGEYTSEPGGGVCQVATTVFNAVYESGLPVISRSNHSLYIASYPAGRDAAVAYPYLDLIWENETSSDILLLMSYTDTSVTATLYGISPGYTVTTETGDWEEGEAYETSIEVDESLESGTSYVKTAGTNGSIIYVIRTVTDEDGNIVRQDRFDSEYDSVTEVIVVGPDTDLSEDDST